MSGIAGVTIEIKQGTTIIATVTTGGDGTANTTLNPGNYTLTFSAPGKNSVQMPLTITQPSTELIFAFPYAVIGGIDLSAGQNMTPVVSIQIPDLPVVENNNMTPAVGLSPQEAEQFPSTNTHLITVVWKNV